MLKLIHCHLRENFLADKTVESGFPPLVISPKVFLLYVQDPFVRYTALGGPFKISFNIEVLCTSLNGFILNLSLLGIHSERESTAIF